MQELICNSVLGGGVAVNSALWWKPHPSDWDVNFPVGWKTVDMQKHVQTVWNRIPGVSISTPLCIPRSEMKDN